MNRWLVLRGSTDTCDRLSFREPVITFIRLTGRSSHIAATSLKPDVHITMPSQVDNRKCSACTLSVLSSARAASFLAAVPCSHGVRVVATLASKHSPAARTMTPT